MGELTRREVDFRTLIHHFVARSNVAVGIAADIIKLRTRYRTRMKRRAIAASPRQHTTIVLSSKWPVTTPVVPGIIKMSVGR
jgi:hypothetical protein